MLYNISAVWLVKELFDHLPHAIFRALMGASFAHALLECCGEDSMSLLRELRKLSLWRVSDEKRTCMHYEKTIGSSIIWK